MAEPKAESRLVLLNRNNLRLADLCSKDESRYTLNAIRVTREETVVTNGHYLVRVTLPKVNGNNYPHVEGWPEDSGEWAEVLLPQATAKEAYRNVPRDRSISILNHAVVFKGEDGRVRVGTTDLDQNKMVEGKITGRYPNWKAVMPAGDPVFEIVLDAVYLAKLLKDAATFQEQPESKCGVRLRFWGPDKAAQIDARNDEGQEWTAILATQRSGRFDTRAVPDPFADVPEPSEAAETEEAAEVAP